MIGKAIIAVALASVVSAATPPGFEPAVSTDLFVAFGDKAAIDGVDLPKAVTSSAPRIGTTQQLFGTYTVMMVDPDIPPQIAGGPTSQLLHWMQGGLIPATTATTIAGKQIFELTNANNVSAIAPYFGPSPPARIPLSHRYTQLLLNTTGNPTAQGTLMMLGSVRQNFSAVNVVKMSGLTPLFGNSFNVTNTTGLLQSNITQVTASARTSTVFSTATVGGATATGTGLPKSVNAAPGTGVNTVGAVVAGLGALLAAMALL